MKTDAMIVVRLTALDLAAFQQHRPSDAIHDVVKKSAPQISKIMASRNLSGKSSYKDIHAGCYAVGETAKSCKSSRTVPRDVPFKKTRQTHGLSC